MPTVDQSVDSLHQKASAQYLQGDFSAALETWKQILVSSPQDERALEGMRLCQLLTEESAVETGTTVTSAPASIVVAETEPIEAIEPIDFELLDIDTEEPPAAESAAAEPVAPRFNANDIDFGSADDAPALELAAGDSEGPLVDAVLCPQDTALSELQIRVQNLMTEAREAYVAGDTDMARSVLSRVFILDEESQEALDLQERIEDNIPAETEFASVADLDAPEHDAAPGEFDLAADAPGSDDTLALESAPQIDLEAIEVVPSPAIDAAEETQEFDELPLDNEVAPSRPATRKAVESAGKAPRFKLPQISLGGSNTPWVAIGIIAAVVIVVGGGFWMKLRSVEIRDDSGQTQPDNAVQGVATTAGPEAAAPSETVAVEDPAPTLTAAPTEDIATLFTRGNGAMASGNYAAAIVAFNAILKQDPAHTEARDLMAASTESYRKQQEIEEQWLQSATLFSEGEYRSALQMFYRLPTADAASEARLNRYKANGWYNLGVLAIRSKQCDAANEHFGEAAQLDPHDRETERGVELATACAAASQTTEFQRMVKAVSLRKLND